MAMSNLCAPLKPAVCNPPTSPPHDPSMQLIYRDMEDKFRKIPQLTMALSPWVRATPPAVALRLGGRGRRSGAREPVTAAAGDVALRGPRTLASIHKPACLSGAVSVNTLLAEPRTRGSRPVRILSLPRVAFPPRDGCRSRTTSPALDSRLRCRSCRRARFGIGGDGGQLRDVLSGRVDLVILRVKRMDKGSYCCRVDIDGYFNDQKVSYTLRVVKAPVVTTVPVPICATSPEPPALTERVWEEEQLNVDNSKRNSSLSKSGTVEEKLIPSPSLQINIPVLSLSLSLLLVLLLGSLVVLGFKRKLHRRILKRGSCSLSTMEPRHIIYEIQTRRPMVENIYTLD
ncbi:hypothetical protein SKAU_G00269790 [Synaphobranchus kaupii]|uniref:Uncharacterized protein n=1 Tax=Synaphobranchus kaupii TaxID=118154 RepID=A0A9Q1IPJ8_SYNKA|nr:hypothetical protein SKAU_G00269790 [Synaphobranchus kaupii]